MKVVFTRDVTREVVVDNKTLILCGPSRRYVDRFPGARVFDGARVHVPIEVVEAAKAALGDADTILAIGGGSPIGLGKALRLERQLRFVVVPTTYAGSEQTSLYGITRGPAAGGQAKDKRTGRDPRVVPDLVVYDATLACDMPLVLTAQSLCNAIAHVASAASTGSTDTQPARDAFKALEELLVAPRDLDARERAARAASACAAILERGKAGMQHALAHQLGGALNLDHAAVHSILLPHFLAWSKVNIGIEPAQIQDVLVRAGAPTKLSELGVNAAAVGGALATRPDLPAQIAFAAQ